MKCFVANSLRIQKSDVYYILEHLAFIDNVATKILLASDLGNIVQSLCFGIV